MHVFLGFFSPPLINLREANFSCGHFTTQNVTINGEKSDVFFNKLKMLTSTNCCGIRKKKRLSVLLLKNNQFWAANSNSTLHWIVSHQPHWWFSCNIIPCVKLYEKFVQVYGMSVINLHRDVFIEVSLFWNAPAFLSLSSLVPMCPYGRWYL